MQIVVVSRETIKPSSTTPQHLRNLKLSFLDQINAIGPDLRILLFYSAQGDARPFQNTDMASLLKKFLPRTLDEFYPLAGRLSSDLLSIDCDDSGVEFIEARVNAPSVLRRLLIDPNAEELYLLYPPATTLTAGGHLCAVQVTIFEGCGGMVLGVRIPHLIGDASALSMFVDTWAAIARGDRIVSPKFGFSDIIPPRNLAAIMPPMRPHEGNQQEIPKLVKKFVTKRFVFNKSEIAALISHCGDQSPTRVQVACAFIFKCLINVLRSESSKPIILYMAIGWRQRMTPPVPPHHVGNLAYASFSKEITEPESFPSLVGQMRQMIQNIDSDYLKNMLADDSKLLLSNIESFMQLYLNDMVHPVGISSLCGLPFYEADFGWGRPIWTAPIFLNLDKFLLINDTKNGGVEAWVTLNEDDLTKFESEHKLLLGDLSILSMSSKI